MRTWLLIFILFITSTFNAIALNPDISVEETVDSLLREARPLISSDPDRAEVLIKDALRIAEDGGFMKANANALNYLGIIYYNKKNYPTAIKYFQQSLKVLFRIGNKEKVANMMKKIGLSYLNQQKYAKAIEYYKLALKVFEQTELPGREANTHVEIGVIYRLYQRFSDAINQFDEAFVLYEKLDNKGGQAESLHHIAKTYHLMGNYKKADEFFTQTLKVYENYLDYSGLATVYNDYSRTLIELEAFRKAEEMLTRAEEQCSTGDTLLMGKISANYGAVLVYQSEYDKAEQYLNRALELAEKTKNEDLLAQVYKNLYELNFRNNQTKKALSFYQKYIAVKDTTAVQTIKEYGSAASGAKLSNIIIFITVFGSIIIIGLVIWLIAVIRQRDRALAELAKKD